MSDAKSVIIIGGGVVGLCTAWYAQQKGHHVTILERGGPDHDRASHGNAGMIVPSHFVPLAAPGMVELGLRMMLQPNAPFYMRPRASAELIRWGWLFARSANAAHVTRSAPLLRDLNVASRSCYEELAKKFDNVFDLKTLGLLMLCKTERGLHEEAKLADQAKSLDVPAEVLDAKQVAAVDPNIQMDVAGGVYFPNDAHLTPQAFTQRLEQALVDGGAKLLWHTEVTGWRASGGRIRAVFTSNREELYADEFVLAGGAWSPSMVRELGIRMPMQAGKGYSMTMPHPRHQPRVCSILTEARVAVTPMGDTLRFGGTMEIAGINDEPHHKGRVGGITAAACSYFPQFQPSDFDELPVWSGLRPCSPDGLPYIGRFKRYANLSAATGHSMMGMSLGPITGQLMASVLSNEKPDINIEALSPDRFNSK